MRLKFYQLSLMMGAAFVATACGGIAPPMTAQETEIQQDFAASQYMPATREMRDAIETQELFAQAAFWSREYDLNPADLESAIKLSAAVRKLGNAKRAVEITQTTRALFPRDPYLTAEFAASLIADERALDAMAPIEQGLAMAPGYARLWSLKGAALDQQERYNEARQNYNRALQITPNDPSVLANLGLSFALAGDAATAETWLRRAAGQPGASAAARQNLGLVLQLQGKSEEAERLAGMTRAPQAFPNQPVPAMAPRPAQTTPTAYRAPQGPATQLRTSAAPGQRFSSASDAARAMATRPAQSQAPQTAPTDPAAQQAMLARIAQSLQPQNAQPPQGAPRTQAPQSYPQQQYDPAPQMAGGPATAPQAYPSQPQRRRR